ncbi:MAG: hypothetical protein M3P08_19625 [Thermoproteota archaeon]|nr:hypothetical protein [Thermoproteota archaeon]
MAGEDPIQNIGIGKMDAGIGINFKKSNSIIFHLTGCRGIRINDIESLGKDLISRYKSNKWEKDNVVVTEIISAQKAAIMISKEKDSKFEANASGTLTGQDTNLAEVEFTKTSHHGIEFKGDSKGNLTPLFKAHGIKNKYSTLLNLGPVKFKPIANIDLSQVKIIDASDITVIDPLEQRVDESQTITIDPSEVEIVGFDEVDYDDFNQTDKT